MILHYDETARLLDEFLLQKGFLVEAVGVDAFRTVDQVDVAEGAVITLDGYVLRRVRDRAPARAVVRFQCAGEDADGRWLRLRVEVSGACPCCAGKN